MTPTLDAVRREELRKLAGAATPGPWTVFITQNGIAAPELTAYVRQQDDHIVAAMRPGIVENRYADNAAYIAAMSPDTALALLAYIAELGTALESTLRRFENCARHVGNDDETIAAATSSTRALLPNPSVREERG